MVWNDLLFLTGEEGAVGYLSCLDASTGTLLWDRRLSQASPGDLPEGATGGISAPTPATDGRLVFALFANGEMCCVDRSGREVWRKRIFSPLNSYGHASSVALWKETVILQVDSGVSGDAGLSFIAALRKEDGSVVWKTPRPVANSWSTPVIARVAWGPVLVASGNPWVIAYNPDTGTELWRVRCLDGDVVPTPVVAGNLVIAADGGTQAVAISLDGVDRGRVVWNTSEGVASIASPVSDGARVLFCEGGDFVCLNAATAAVLWKAQAGTATWASPVIAGATVYVPDLSGKVFALEMGDSFRLLASSPVPGAVTATPAFSRGRIFIRTESSVLCCAQDAAETARQK